ncbi:hypothetical protein [Streptomyces johnsoniae]|uniref:Lipoprotein n=1 Tax=Streptomyces johnsoniae TaxID=3075532 RepID=A0ABU2RYL5_9ACTN|nr:hypothetical protein [Streptomyces sp. DSM 41886]MDT0441511.1 hypothetical protein [Streptomyces sp. DSM 41886]
MASASGRVRPYSRLIGICALLLTVTSCSGDSDDDRAPEVGLEPATRICDGTLTASAAEDLEALTAEDTFKETTVPSVPPADLEEFLDVLRASTAGHEDFCFIYRADDDRATLSLAFGWRESTPTDFEPAGDEAAYATGDFAYADTRMASLYFPCGIRNMPEDFVSARLYTHSGPMTSHDARTSILNSVSRAVAEGLGCLEGAGLVEGRPERVG